MIDRLPLEVDLQTAGGEVFKFTREEVLQMAEMADASALVRTLMTMGTTGIPTATKFAWIAVRLLAIGILAERKRNDRQKGAN